MFKDPDDVKKYFPTWYNNDKKEHPSNPNSKDYQSAKQKIGNSMIGADLMEDGYNLLKANKAYVDYKEKGEGVHPSVSLAKKNSLSKKLGTADRKATSTWRKFNNEIDGKKGHVSVFDKPDRQDAMYDALTEYALKKDKK